MGSIVNSVQDESEYMDRYKLTVNNNSHQMVAFGKENKICII